MTRGEDTMTGVSAPAISMIMVALYVHMYNGH
jgi:hypothetical protein